MACKYYYKGEELSYEEFAEKLANGLLQETLKRMEAGKPPVEPPKGKTTEGEGDSRKQRERAVIKSMIKSVPESQRERVEKDGLYYNPTNSVEAREIANSVYSENGVDAALDMARNPRVNGMVRAALYSDILNGLDRQILKTENKQDAERLAIEFADIFIELGESGTLMGQFGAGIGNIFYKSELGQYYIEERKKQKIFSEKEKENGKSWDEALKEFKESEEFAAIVAEEVDKVLVKDKGFAKKAANSLRAKADKIEKEGLKAALPSWLKADLPEGTQQQGLDINAFNKAVAASLRIIATTIEGAGKLAEVISEQAKELKQKFGLSADEKEIRDWLRQEYRNTGAVEKAFEEKVKDRIESLTKSIETLKAKIAEGKYEPKEKPVTNEEIAKLEKEKKELSKQYNEIKKGLPAYKEKVSEMFLDKLAERLSGMNKAQKGEVIRRMFKKIVDKGGLERDEFREIIADVLGLGKMDEQTAKQFKEYVGNISKIEEIAKEYVDNPTAENLKKFEKAQALAVDSKRELSRIVYNQIDLGSRAKQMIQLSVMSPPTLAKNISWNLVESATRSGENMALAAMDRALQASSVLLNKVTGGKTNVYEPKTSFFGEIGAYTQAVKYGFKESINTLKKGTSSKDLFASTSVESPIQPLKAIQQVRKELDLRLKEALSGRLNTEVTEGERLSNEALLDKAMVSTAGWYAEAISRGLTFGDKPARYGPEAAKAVSMAKYELGIKDEKQLEIFAKFPKQSAYKFYKQQGIGDVEAKYRADVFEKRALRQGERAVMQQDNILSDFYKLSSEYLEKNLSEQAWYPLVKYPSKFITTPASLFVKTPANVAWRVFKLANPEISIIQAAMQFNKAAKLKKAGDEAYKIELDDARQNLGTAAVGMGIASVVGSMVVAGIITPSAEDKDRKGRVASQNYEKGFTFNFSRFGRWIMGKPLETPKDEADLIVDLSWLGAMGSIMDLKARLYSGAKKDGEEVANYISQLASRLFESADVSANATILEAQKTFTKALTSPSGFNNFMSSTVSTWLSPLPAMGGLSRAMLPYEYRIKGDNFLEQLKNRIAADNIIYRKLSKNYPPSKIGLWGDEIKKSNDWASMAQRYFGISKTNPDPFAQPIYNDFRKTMNPKFLPSEPNADIQKDGIEIKLTQNELDAYKQYVGFARKQYVLALLNAKSLVVKRNGSDFYTGYDGLNEEEKLILLQDSYRGGMELGKELFFKDPKYSYLISNIPKKTKDEQQQEARLKRPMEKEGAKLKKNYKD